MTIDKCRHQHATTRITYPNIPPLQANPAVPRRGPRAPRWLAVWGSLAVVAELLTVMALVPGGLTPSGFLVVPVGLGWTCAAGFTALRSG